MKIVSIPDELADQVKASGADLDEFVVEAVRQKLSTEPDTDGETLGERIRQGWKAPTVRGKPRADGIAWSEIEAASDAA